MNPPSLKHRCIPHRWTCTYESQLNPPIIEAQMPSIQVHYISSFDRSSTMHIYTGGRCLAYWYITFISLIDLAQYIYIYRKQMLLSDEVYRLWYFNYHITTLFVSEHKCYMLYRKDNKSQKEDLKWYMLSSKDKNSYKKILHLLVNRYIYTEMETSGMVNL